MAESRPPAAGPNGIAGEFAVGNPSCGLLHATGLYGFIRALAARRVVELGSGLDAGDVLLVDPSSG